MSNLPIVSSPLSKKLYTDRFYEFLPLYVADGSPSKDTLDSYRKNISSFIYWCRSNNSEPLDLSDIHIRLYRRTLTEKGYSLATIHMKIVSIRVFYHIAVELKLIDRNPCEGISSKAPHIEDLQFFYYSIDEISKIANTIKEYPDPMLRARTMLELYLMGIEGLRVVELHRANLSDIDWQRKYMLVRGKGHYGTIYPCKETLDAMKAWIDISSSIKRNDNALFISLGHRHLGGRLSRDSIRDSMNQALTLAGLKKDGKSCHALRHSCGTALYEETKDLRLVQEVLRQKDPKVTARYAHVSEKNRNRATEFLGRKL